MCGICGYISTRDVAKEELYEMNQMMRHRGPDDEGIWQGHFQEKHIGLAHRRLSILDLSSLGHQPMISEDDNVVIVFNGEIYNYRELREELMTEGLNFYSNCDTEVILNSYRTWGLEKTLLKLNGMFAFAIYDNQSHNLILARDRIGKKPLFYYFQNREFVFGSELKAIMKFRTFEKKINISVLGEYLCHQYINAPNTIFYNTNKLAAGHYLIYDGDRINIRQYWDLYEQYKLGKNEIITDYTKCKQILKDKLYESVAKRLIADVPVGTFLSGGIDSTLVTAIANDILAEKVKTFTIGFFDEKINEAIYAKKASEFLGTDHTELYISKRAMLDMVHDIPYYYDEPFADSSEIPTMLVSNLAKSKVTVVLSGDGGDEFFCGYSSYDTLYYAMCLEPFTQTGNYIISRLGKDIKEKLPRKVKTLFNNGADGYKVQFFTDIYEKFAQKMLVNGIHEIKHSEEKKIQIRNWQERRMLLDMYTYLPEDILTKADRASMKYSLEMRCPLLDVNVMEFSFRIPHKYKYNGRNKKYILKDILYDFIPETMMNRPKRGFGVPLGKWLRTYLSNDIQRVSQKTFLEKQNIFHYNTVCELVKKVNLSDEKPYVGILWAYYVFQLWYEKYM